MNPLLFLVLIGGALALAASNAKPTPGPEPEPGPEPQPEPRPKPPRPRPQPEPGPDGTPPIVAPGSSVRLDLKRGTVVYLDVSKIMDAPGGRIERFKVTGPKINVVKTPGAGGAPWSPEDVMTFVSATLEAPRQVKDRQLVRFLPKYNGAYVIIMYNADNVGLSYTVNVINGLDADDKQGPEVVTLKPGESGTMILTQPKVFQLDIAWIDDKPGGKLREVAITLPSGDMTSVEPGPGGEIGHDGKSFILMRGPLPGAPVLVTFANVAGTYTITPVSNDGGFRDYHVEVTP